MIECGMTDLRRDPETQRLQCPACGASMPAEFEEQLRVENPREYEALQRREPRK